MQMRASNVSQTPNTCSELQWGGCARLGWKRGHVQALVAEGVPQTLELASLVLEVLALSAPPHAASAGGLRATARDLVQALLSGSPTVALLPSVSACLRGGSSLVLMRGRLSRTRVSES